MQEFLNSLKEKSIHIVGVTGSEGSSILRFLTKHKIKNITTHDYIDSLHLEKNFKLWHKGVDTFNRNRLFQQFLNDLKKTQFHANDTYLEDIENSDIICVPQSWRLYKDQNKKLFEVKLHHIHFYSLTRLYLSLSQATTIGVTGTVGKGSTAYLISELLKKLGKNVYFAGNESWMVQSLDKLNKMQKGDFLVLEISHRQLLDGLDKAPHIAVLTNIYQNHLDELSWTDYVNSKFLLLDKQSVNDFALLNYDNAVIRQRINNYKQKIMFFSAKSKQMNTQNIQKYYRKILDIKSTHYIENILAALATIDILHFSLEDSLPLLPAIKSLPARVEFVGELNGRSFYDDLKSTTPWATFAAVNKFDGNCILICGGRTKGIDYLEFLTQIKEKVKKIIILQSDLSRILKQHLPDVTYEIVDTLKHALQIAYENSTSGDTILISPAAGFFYTNYIKGKQSIKKLLISLPQLEKKSGDLN